MDMGRAAASIGGGDHRLRNSHFRRAFKVYRHWLYWLAVLVCGFGAEVQTWALADWTPSAGLTGQTFSLIARLGLAYTIDILLWCFVLALVAYYLDPDSSVESRQALACPSESYGLLCQASCRPGCVAPHSSRGSGN